MPQNVAAVLSEAFGKNGAGALSYAPEFAFLLQEHLKDLSSDLPSLHIKTREYTHIDGRSAQLLLAEGTVPMYYQGVKYNIPVAIWLPEQYPLAAPLAYVVPTPDMIIKPRHSFVDASGLVHTPYISQWQYPASNLRDMAQDMSMHFGGDPPLFSKPKGWTPPPSSSAGPGPSSSSNVSAASIAAQQQQRPPPAAYPSFLGSGSGDVGADTFHAHNPLAAQRPYGAPDSGRPPAPDAVPDSMESVWAAMMASAGSQQQGSPPPPVAQPPPSRPPRENPTAKLSAAFRTAAAASLNRRLHVSLTALAQQAAAEGEEQVKLQATLRQRGEQLKSQLAALQVERVALDKLSHDLAASSSQLDRWLADNEHLAAAAADPSQLDPDVVISAADPLSQQALEVQSQDLALEDALYALDKSLNSAAIEPDAYLKQVRAVCRRQFFVRTLGNKVAVAQQEQQQRAPPPPPPPMHRGEPDVQRQLSAGRPVVLPQGDSWANAGVASSSGNRDGAAAAGPWYPATYPSMH